MKRLILRANTKNNNMQKFTQRLAFTASLVLSLASSSFGQITEDFETTPLTGWTFYQTESDDPGFVQTSSQAHSGSSSFFHDDNNLALTSTSWMVSPAYTCGSNDELIFWFRQNFTGSYYNYSGVHISTASNDPITNPGDFTEIEEFNATSSTGFSEDVWTEYVSSLSAYAGQTIHIAFKYSGDFQHEFYIDDFSLNAAPTCPEPELLTLTTIDAYSAGVTWTVMGSEPAWELEYGPAGFTPGTGLTQIETSNTGTLSGLNPNTAYDVYVRGLCGVGDTSIYSNVVTFNTNCLAMNGLGYCESFDSDSQNENCWRVLDNNNDGDTWDLNYQYNTNSGDQVAMLYTDYNSGNNDDYLISPNLILTGNEVFKFSYRVQSSYEANDFQVLLSTTGSNPADFTDTLMALDTYDNTTYMDTSLDLSNYTGQVYIAFNVPPGGLDGYRLFIDDVCIEVCIPTPGVDGQQNVCMTDSVLNLNEVATKNYNNGAWYFPASPIDLYDDSLINIQGLPQDNYRAMYILETGCGISDTTFADFSIYQLSSAGGDGMIDVCKNQPINLYEGLAGNIDLGGTWVDYQNQVLASSQPIAPSIPGSFNYRYYASNGVCPEDTSLLVINVGSCDYLGLEEEMMQAVSVYPNPTQNLINIEAPTDLVADVNIIDSKGRVVFTHVRAFDQTAVLSVDMSQFDNGIYFVQLIGEATTQTLRFVKH